ncbi:hypothetical protein OGAPHI_007008 [Ogataea philodendri]|uniref:Uncharacterized protein n=1 Tax=Ogataea philodendri TaxID=1378263 RepID=A0A9P8NVJ3_9ASCO|nr:uncharacterized protein OGAPHI_007008 [Ogataea philodendri]KAH3660422.1 hypothetical protein OGAPHI_007008 [Ogataea philodendri]
MQRWERAKDHRSSAESGGVHVETKVIIHSAQSTRTSSHRVISWLESIEVLVPRRSRWEHLLDQNSNKIHVSERPAKRSKCGWRSEDPNKSSHDKWADKMHYSVWEPGNEIQRLGGICSQDV